MARKKSKVRPRQTNSTFRSWVSRLIGGDTKLRKQKALPGQLVSFKYNTGDAKSLSRKIPRLVFVLNPRDTLHTPNVLHGINLEYTSYQTFIRYLKQIQTEDLITLIKRRYEVRGPFADIIDNPAAFYSEWVKPYIEPMGAYRTYKINRITQMRLHAINYNLLFPNASDAISAQLMDKFDTIRDILGERTVMSGLLGKNATKLTSPQYKKLVEERFLTLADFKSAVSNIEDYIDTKDGGTEDDGNEEVEK